MTTNRSLNRRQFVLGTAGALALSFSRTSPLLRNASATVDVFVVVSGPLNLRTGPGLGYRIIRSLPTGTQLEVIDTGGTADGYTWVEVYVTSLNITGFVASEFIERRSFPDDTEFPVGANVVTNAAVNLRSGAGLRHRIIVTLWNGAPVTITGTPVAADGNTWYPVRTGYGTNGWVAGEFLSSGAVSNPKFPVGATATTTASLHVRSGAGLTYSIVVTLWNGAPVTITGAPVAASGYTWYPIRTGYGTAGWVAGEFLR